MDPGGRDDVCVWGEFAFRQWRGLALSCTRIKFSDIINPPAESVKGAGGTGVGKMQNKPSVPDARRLTTDYCHSPPREREKFERERRRGRVTLIYLITRTLICFKTAEGGKMSWEDVNTRSRWLLYLQTESFLEFNKSFASSV